MKLSDLVKQSAETGEKLSAVALDLEAKQSGMDKDALMQKMHHLYQVMCESARKGTVEPVISNSTLTGGEGYTLFQYAKGEYCRAAAIAMGVSNVNAAMGRIVASPTAGSCGIVPGVLLTIQQRTGASEDEMIHALFVSGMVGKVIAQNASISGAEGGCQAECGSASAMAAAAGVQLCGGSAESSMHAAAMTIKAVMGLVCDPVAGLVEVPCVKRNAFGAVQAMLAIDMALAGIKSVIPADEVIDAMGKVGCMIHPSLRETASGGLAATKTGQEIAQRLK